MTCGVYKLESPSGKFYVGSSVNIERRESHHQWAARHRRFRRSPKLYRAYAKYGNLRCSVLVVCSERDLLLYEQACIDALQPAYNCTLIAGKVEQTAEVRAKIGASNKGKPRSPELRARISATKKGCIPWMAGRRHTPEALAKMSAARKGKSSGPMTPERRANISAAKKGRPNGLEGRPKSDEFRAKVAATLKGRSHSAERIANIRAGRHPSPKVTPEIAAAIIDAHAGGQSQASLARQYGISGGYACRICGGATWHADSGDRARPKP